MSKITCKLDKGWPLPDPRRPDLRAVVALDEVVDMAQVENKINQAIARGDVTELEFAKAVASGFFHDEEDAAAAAVVFKAEDAAKAAEKE